MLKTIEAVNSAVNNFIWGIPAMVCIIGVGLYLSFRTGFIQIRKFPYSIKNTLGRIFDKSEAADGSITPFQAVCTALAGTVGTGNIAGVAGAITIGGPGAVFWRKFFMGKICSLSMLLNRSFHSPDHWYLFLCSGQRKMNIGMEDITAIIRFMGMPGKNRLICLPMIWKLFWS